MIDLQSFFGLSYGLYLISSKAEGVAAGCVVNTLAQITVEPAKMSVVIHKDNYTAEIIKKSGFFTGVVLSQDATMDLIGKFGFASSREVDKFVPFATKTDENGVPYVCEQVAARFSCKVVETVDVGTHILFVGEVTAAETVDKAAVPMTYAYYHQNKKGKTPPKAPSYKPEEEKKGYRCKVCGYILESDTLPPDFVCPICKKGAEFFEKI